MARVAKIHTIPARFQTGNTRVVSLMSAALGLKDKYTQAHAQRVADYARRLACRLRLADDQVQDIAMGGMLHDVGKLALSDRIFSNQDTVLSEEMRGQVRGHPLIGAALLKQISCMEPIREVVLYHHERIDGSGYPFGLKGLQIPLGAKIVSVADCFDAVTTDRPYQKGKSLPEAFGVLEEMAGHCLADDLVRLFIEEIRRNGPAYNHPTCPAAILGSRIAKIG